MLCPSHPRFDPPPGPGTAEPCGQKLRAPSHRDTALVFAFKKSDISDGRAAHVEAISRSPQRRASFLPPAVNHYHEILYINKENIT